MSAVLPPRSLRHRSGLRLARRNRLAKARIRGEVGNAVLFGVALVTAIAVWVFACALVGR